MNPSKPKLTIVSHCEPKYIQLSPSDQTALDRNGPQQNLTRYERPQWTLTIPDGSWQTLMDPKQPQTTQTLDNFLVISVDLCWLQLILVDFRLFPLISVELSWS